MKYAIKNKRKIVQAYCLGQETEMERLLIKLHRIRLLPDGRYELMSRESKNGAGQKAAEGDYFKVEYADGIYYPYPNDRAYFLNNHTHLENDLYEQKAVPLAIWQWGDPPCDVMEYLLAQKMLKLDHGDTSRFFNAFLYGADLSAPQDATVVFYDIFRDASGKITDVVFNFVVKDVFENSYTICREESGM